MVYWSKKLTIILARAALAAMLFTQFALAAQACVTPGHAPALHKHGAAHCQDGMNLNACMVHCSQDTQSSNSPPVVAAVDVAPLLIPVDEIVSAIARFQPLFLTRRIEPPIPVRFSSLLI